MEKSKVVQIAVPKLIVRINEEKEKIQVNENMFSHKFGKVKNMVPSYIPAY